MAKKKGKVKHGLSQKEVLVIRIMLLVAGLSMILLGIAILRELLRGPHVNGETLAIIPGAALIIIGINSLSYLFCKD